MGTAKRVGPVRRVEDLPLVIRVDQLREVLGVGRSALYEAIRRGQVRSVRIGRRVLIPRQELERLLTEGNRNGERA